MCLACGGAWRADPPGVTAPAVVADWTVGCTVARSHGTRAQCGEQNAALKSRAFGPRTAAEARRAEAVVAKRLAQRFVLGVRSGRVY